MHEGFLEKGSPKVWDTGPSHDRDVVSRKRWTVSKKGRKRKARAKSGANHGKRPNA